MNEKGWSIRWLVRFAYEPMLKRRLKFRLTVERQR